MDNSKGEVVWVTCLVCILIITACVVQMNIVFGHKGVLAFLFCAFVSLQPFKLAFTCYARNKEYNNNLVMRITNCRAVYQILNQSIFYGGVFAYLLLLAENKIGNIPQSVYFIIILVLACLVSLKPIRPFNRKEQHTGAVWEQGKLIRAFVPRFVILYTFVVYYFLAYVRTSTENIIPSLCVAYIAIERLISMFQTVSGYAEQEYDSLFRGSEVWIRKIRHMVNE